MGQGSITRKASDLRPLLLDRFRNAAAAYSLRPLTLSGQDNPVVKVRRSVDDTEQDFNPAQINDGTLEQFVNAGDVAPADYGTGAAAAYSLRHVSDGYTGDVVRVRRSVDNTEQDFNPTEIEDGTLTSFVGGQNLLTYSEDFASGDSAGVTFAAGGNPEGGTSNSKVITNNGTIFDAISCRANRLSALIGSYTISAFAKAGEHNSLLLSVYWNSNITRRVDLLFNLSSGTVASTTETDPTVIELLSSSITSVGSGWYRCSFSFDFKETGIVRANWKPSDTVQTSGDGVSGVYIWGAQLEEGTTVGDYVPTSGTIAGDGHVTTWYDQSGNSNDATQATAASQPKIVSGGSLVTENGKPAIDFDGVDDNLPFTQITSVSGMTITAIVAFNATTGGGFLYQPVTIITDENNAYVQDFALGARQNKATLYYEDGSGPLEIQSGLIATNTQYVLTGFSDSSSSSISVNGVTTTGAGARDDYVVQNIGGEGLFSIPRMDGVIQEIIVYPDDQSSNRELIETNVNHYYSIYSQTNDGFVTTWYDQSGNGNHATQSTAASQPKIVSAGSLVVENGKAALDFDGVNDALQTASLAISQPYTVFNVVKSDITGAVNFVWSTSTTATSLIFVDTDIIRISAGVSLNSAINQRDTNQTLLSNFYNGATSSIYKDGTSIASGNAGTNTLNDLRVGAPGFANQLFDGKHQEIIVYSDDQSTKRQQIESNLNTHYGIY